MLIVTCLLQAAFGQVPKNNPVVAAAVAIGQKGLSSEGAPGTSPTQFSQTGSRVYIGTYVKALFETEDEQKVFETAIVKLIENYESTAKSAGIADDASGALAFSVAVLNSVAKGSELQDESFLALNERFKATFNTGSVKGATDIQKQEAYEWALCSSGLVLALLSEAKTDESRKKIQVLAAAQLEVLLGAKPDQISLQGKSVSIKGTGAVNSGEGKTAEKPATGGAAPGFAFQPPTGWVKDGAWYVYTTRDGDRITAANIRFPAAIPAAGNMGDALRKLWKENVPNTLQNNAGGMVYRRYVGSKLFTQFIFGSGKEEGRKANSVFTLYLIDCGSYWQPVVVAQTYRMEGNFTAGEEFSAQFSYPTSADYAETMLATFRCASAPNQALASKEAIAGNYRFGDGSHMEYENIYTGATSFKFASHGGTLNLAADGTFTYKYGSASGQVGAVNFRGITAAGTYSIQGDILTCTYSSYDQGDSYKKKEEKYRIAGVTIFGDGNKVTILMDDLKLPVNSVTVANTSFWYSTKK